MITLRKSTERGHADHGWLDTYHSFSFADYYDPQHMHFRTLRVINEDRVAGGGGFDMHPHRDMEIVTYVISGALEHRDSLGNGAVMKAGDVQRMTAGTGIRHSEFNYSPIEPVHLLQIWILPERKMLTPGYEQKSSGNGKAADGLQLVVSPTARDGSLKIHQDAEIYLGKLKAAAKASHALKANRHAWIQVFKGELELNGEKLTAGDGASVSEETALQLASPNGAEFLLFDLK
ncbi:MAG: pirin family protein, partial [Verrucomicrobiota bacterium]